MREMVKNKTKTKKTKTKDKTMYDEVVTVQDDLFDRCVRKGFYPFFFLFSIKYVIVFSSA
jgi:hypothetical protein